MKKAIIILMTLFTTITLSACSNQTTYTNIDNNELKTMLETKENYQFVDVRSKDEYYESHIPGFLIYIDYYQFENKTAYLEDAIATFELDKTQPLVLICNSGNRSVEAAKMFAELGFTTIYNLENGIEAWDGETE